MRFFKIGDVRFHVVNYDNVFGPSGDADQRYFIYVICIYPLLSSLTEKLGNTA